jgi:single-strand DNA-binding protein
MNSVALTGRMARDPEIRYTDGGVSIARFTVAVNRRKKDDPADFIGCIAFGKTAELLEKFFHKGMRIGLNGRIQTGSYTNKDGKKVYTTDIIAEQVEFLDSKSDGNTQPEQKPDANGFVNIPDNVEDEGLPFA